MLNIITMLKQIIEKIVAWIEYNSNNITRIGIGIVFIWFGLSGVITPDMWTGMVPLWALTITSAHTLVVAHGIFELVFGFLFFIGFRQKITGTLLFLSIVQTLTLVSGPTLYRDIAIALATFGSAFAVNPESK